MLNKVVDTTIIEANLGRLYALWLREFKVFLRSTGRDIKEEAEGGFMEKYARYDQK